MSSTFVTPHKQQDVKSIVVPRKPQKKTVYNVRETTKRCLFPEANNSSSVWIDEFSTPQMTILGLMQELSLQVSSESSSKKQKHS